MAWLAGIWVSGIRQTYSLAAGAGCCDCWKICGTYMEVTLELLESVGCLGWWLLSCALLWIPVKSFTASFLNAWKSLSSTLNLRCKLVAEGCSGGLCLGPRKDYSMVSFEQTDLLINCWILENCAGACNRWLLCGVWSHAHLLSIHVSWTSGDFVCWGCSCTGCLDLGLEAWRFTESLPLMCIKKLNLSWIWLCLSIISLRARPDFDWVSFL